MGQGERDKKIWDDGDRDSRIMVTYLGRGGQGGRRIWGQGEKGTWGSGIWNRGT